MARSAPHLLLVHVFMIGIAAATVSVTGCGDDSSPARPDAAGHGERDAGGVDGGETDAGTAVPPTCSRFGPGASLGNVANAELTEISGVVSSRQQLGVLYVHNDSGESRPRFFAIDENGRHLAEIRLVGATFTDWEDIAIGPGDDGDEIYLGDIGDNAARDSGGATGRGRITVYRVREPAIPAGGVATPIELDQFDTFRFTYPDHPHDAEAMFVDPATRDLYLITKENDGLSTVFRAAAPISTDGAVTLEAVGSIAFGSATVPGSPQATAADIAPAGDAILVRTYLTVLQWDRAPGASIANALSADPTPLSMTAEMQGEAVTFAGDGRGYFTISEGAGAPVNYFDCAE